MCAINKLGTHDAENSSLWSVVWTCATLFNACARGKNLAIKSVHACVQCTHTVRYQVCILVDDEAILFAAWSISLRGSRGADRGSEHPRGSAEEGKVHSEERERSAQTTENQGG